MGSDPVSVVIYAPNGYIFHFMTMGRMLREYVYSNLLCDAHFERIRSKWETHNVLEFFRTLESDRIIL